MGAADDQIRVSESVKREIERRRREGESYNDVLERLFSIDRDRNLLAGFGRWSDERADRARETRETYEEKSIERMRRQREDA
jgi:predicted CopG family antitoxin